MKIPFFEGELIRKGALVFLATLSASLIAFFANLIISRALGPQSFGYFKTVVYLFAFLPAIIDFGINSTLTKYAAELGKNRIKNLVKWLLKIKILSYVFLIAAIFILKDYLALYFLKDVSLSYLIIAGIFFAALSFFSTFSFIILGLQNFKLFSLSNFLSSSLQAIFALLLIPLGIYYMILGWGLGLLIGNIPNVFFLLKGNLKDKEKVDVKKIFFKFSLPIYPIELTTSLINAIIPLLSLFFSQILIGYYSFAFMFYWAAQLIPSSLSIVLFPKISELNGLKKYGHARNILKKSFLYYSLVVIAGLVFVFLLSEWFINTVAKDYLPCLFVFKTIVSLGFLFGYNVIYVNYLKGLGKIKRFAFFVLLQNILLIAVSFALLSSIK